MQKLNGQNVGKPFTVAANTSADRSTLTSNFTKPALWSAEYPNLYRW
ncbi:hypothetical protein HK413_13890 [Mucilaginibacter sp. S1162]|uniref:Uncharacterized protein n=1 Tax=Mucilaginibacter humi TaxID=2732510 RepID=A0ABX1W6W4_9SPHI|nr:hypothetical protein [Mucilaginibacter humi]